MMVLMCCPSTELCSTLKSTNKTKHIQTRINYIREYINNRIISLVFIPSDKNVADIHTKPLAEKQFEAKRNILLNGFGGYMEQSSFMSIEQVNLGIDDTNLVII